MQFEICISKRFFNSYYFFKQCIHIPIALLLNIIGKRHMFIVYSTEMNYIRHDCQNIEYLISAKAENET